MFSLQYEIFVEDYLDAGVIWSQKPWVKWIILRGFPAFMIVFCITSTLFFDDLFESESEPDKLFFRFLLIAGFVSVIAFYNFMRPPILVKRLKVNTSKFIDQDRSRIGRRQTLVDEQGILISREGEFGRIYVLWKNIHAVYETDDLFVFYYFDYFDFSRRTYHTFIPKRAFESDIQLADFRNAITSFRCSLKVMSIGTPYQSPELGSDRPHTRS